MIYDDEKLNFIPEKAKYAKDDKFDVKSDKLEPISLCCRKMAGCLKYIT